MTIHDELTAFLRQISVVPGDCFADVFLAGDRDGIRPVPREAFLAALPRRRELFAQAGAADPTLDRLTFEELDERYLFARTEWIAGPYRLISSYLLHRKEDGQLEVVVYLNHQGL